MRGMITRGSLVAALVLLAALGVCWRTNSAGAVQRDGAHFLFMAMHIAHGKPPYWASWETKNPLVEFYWAPWMAAWPASAPLQIPARAAEHAWMGLSALLLSWWVRRTVGAASGGRSAMLLASASACAYVCLLLHPRVSDGGLNIAMYQTLPELTVLALAWAIGWARTGGRVWGPALALGIASFGVWFVKQSAPLAVLPALGIMLLVAPARGALLRAYLLAVGMALALVGAFALSLSASGTLANYLEGTHGFKATILDRAGWAAVWDRLSLRLRPQWFIQDPFPRFVTPILYLGAIGLILTFVWSWPRFRRGLAPEEGARLVSAAWCFGAVLQSAAGVLFFHHYFLSAIAPAVVLIAAWAGTRLWARIAVGSLLAAFAVLLLFGVASERDRVVAAAESAPIVDTINRAAAIIPHDATVFNWNGLPHYHVMRRVPSAHAKNMWWPFILAAKPESERRDQLRATLAPAPPDFVLEILEDYPPEQNLTPFPLDADTLGTLTGARYRVVGEIETRPGRYGAPARIWARTDDP